MPAQKFCQLQRLKTKLGRSRILTEVTAFTPFTPYKIHLPVCNSQVVIDHTFMTICLNLADFPDFFLLETLTSLLLRSTLTVDWKVSLRLENYLAASRIGSERLNVMLLVSQSSEFKSTSERFWGSYVIYSFWWTQ